MARPATGSIVERDGKRGVTFGLRFRAGGKRHYVSTTASTRAEAAVELANTLADVRRGRWQPPKPAPVIEVEKEPTFHEFSSEWMTVREQEGLAEKTVVDLRWSLSNHLLPFFAGHRLSEITPREVDRYKVAKAQERAELETARAEAEARGEKYQGARGLSNSSINHVLSDLAQVLETAVEYGLLAANPASGKRRRLKAAKPHRPWVEPEQLPALLDGARTVSSMGYALLATLAGSGLRIGEVLALRWQHVDLATGTLHVAGSKTDAGVRSVDLPAGLREDMTTWRATSTRTGPADYVFSTSTGAKHNASNLRRDVLRPAVEAANVELEQAGIAALDGITFHSLRRTYASLRCACGDDLRWTSTQLGHVDVRFTMATYAQATKRRERLSGPHLKAYDRALGWAAMAFEFAQAIPEASNVAMVN